MSRDTLYNVHGISPSDTAFGNLLGDTIFYGDGAMLVAGSGSHVSYLPQSAAPASSGDFAYLGMLALALGLLAAVLVIRRPQK